MAEVPELDYSSGVFQSEEEADAYNLQLLWKAVQNKRGIIVTITGIAFVFSLLYALHLPTVYTARTKIFIEGGKESAFQNPEMMESPAANPLPTYFQTRAEMLKSHHILEQAAKELNLVEHYQKVNKRIKTNEEAADLLGDDKTNVKLLKGTQIVQLSVTDTDPQWAAKIADGISDTFIKESWRERLFISEQILEWFPKEGETLQKSSGINQLRQLDKEGAITSLPSVAKDPVINSIKEERIKVDAMMRELSKRYTSEHPKIKELQARADYLESEMKSQIQKIVSGLKSGLSGEFSASNMKVIERAEIPTKPSGPKRLVMVSLSTLIALFLSIVLAVQLNNLDLNIKAEEDVRQIPMPFLGYLPQLDTLAGDTKSDRRENLLEHVLTDMRLMDDITNIRAAVLFSMPADRSKLLMFTSTIPEEGKTTVASLFGMSLAHGGEKVLLIDADMRKPALHQIFGLENKIGLSHCLVGTAKPQEAIQKIDKIPGLSIMTAGVTPPNPAALLGSSMLERLIQELEPHYRRIVFDGPPGLHIIDSLLLSAKVHGTILIFGFGKIHRNIAKKMKERILSAKGTLIGAAINGTDYKKLDYASYTYYQKYSKYYGVSKAGD
ncbi:MAG: hypothetical protein A3C35_08435 [Omnitrophica bacterium RIFCSPHIGHO2_02_FULL_46_11]|nr:MAG: hypothetical protein A3C35_08435 [Omnitrophica bacterium RIFCSPHIGHO2_02_FULL_46_11]OGW87821.1 MAG: hypothetical protein A3A81_01890 [Omnitrophica bacterium RIFCSPLOWO2_01_FULL_45_10b]